MHPAASNNRAISHVYFGPIQRASRYLRVRRALIEYASPYIARPPTQTWLSLIEPPALTVVELAARKLTAK